MRNDPRPRYFRFMGARLSLLLVLLVALSCCRSAVSERDIDQWKRSAKAGRIAKALLGRKTSTPVRIRAARALVELAADSHFQHCLHQLDRAMVATIAHALAPDLDRLLASPDLARQVLAKDFLGLFILAGDRGTTERVGGRLVTWLTADFNRRLGLGRVSALPLLEKIGVPALPALHGLLRPGNDLLRIAKVIRAIGDRGGNRHAADLIHRAILTQKPKISARSLRALFTIGGPRAALRLAQLAADPRFSVRSRRLAAEEMRALAHRATRGIAERLALDSREDLYVRESALLTLEKVCDGACGPILGKLWKVLGRRGLRFEAAAVILKIGKVEVLPRLLRRLPAGIYSVKGVRNLARDVVRHLGAGALPALRRAVGRGRWPGRLVAIHALGLLGTPKDAALLGTVGGRARPPTGWKGNTTLAQEAARAAKRIRHRKK